MLTIRCSRSRNRQQPRLGFAVRLHRDVVIQMVAAQVGERGRVKMYAVDPALIQGMRGHFHRDIAHTERAQTRECAVYADGIGGGVGRRLERADAAPADRAHIGRFRFEAREALRQQVRAGGLAVGARDADDAQLRGGPVEEPVGDAAHGLVQFNDRRAEHRRCEGGRLHSGSRLPKHRARAARGRLGRECDAVRLAPAQSKEEAAGAYLAAVESEIRDARIVRRYRRDAVEQPHERYACAAHGAFACTSLVAGTFCRSSGGTSMRRSAPDMTLEKTGAATVPP